MLKVEIIGNIGNDATVKDFYGKKYIAFNVAHSEKFKDAQGNTTERTTWVSVLKPGESNVVQYLKKGTGVYVCGDLSVKAYTDSQRQTQVGVNCLAREVQLLPGGKREQSQQTQDASSNSTSSTPASPKGNEELPF
jgi:single-strand DNA-binding protein